MLDFGQNILYNIFIGSVNDVHILSCVSRHIIKTSYFAPVLMEKKMKQKLDNFFKISERGSNFKTEIIAGLTTFFAMAYIVVVNPNSVAGFQLDQLSGDLRTIWLSVYVASLFAAVVGTLLYAFYAKLPYAQACGMGLNAFFFVSFILPNLIFDESGSIVGGDPIKGYKEGLFVILLSGVIFVLLSMTGAREHIARALPDCLKKAIPAGIGLFIAMIGFKNVGIIQGNQYTLVQLFDFHAAVEGKSFFEGWVSIAPVVLTLGGLFLITVLEKKGLKGSIITSILVITVLYYLTTWTLPDFDISQVGDSFKAFGEIGIFTVFEGYTIFTTKGIVNALVFTITFCLVNMFDTIGTLYGTASQANMLDESGDPIDMDKSMVCDSISTVTGALLGTSTCTTFVESSSGIAAGGRSGFASIITSLCFFLCLFLTPVASIVPLCATAPALIYVGVLMLKNFANVDMTDISSAVPAFLALIMMPLTYSISNGIAVGAIAYTLITLFSGKYTKKDIIVTAIAVLFTLRFFLVSM